MTFASLTWGAGSWLPVASALAVMGVGCAIWAYLRAAGRPAPRLGMALLKIAALLLIAWCLAEPLFHGKRPRPGANVFVVLADNSQSMNLRGAGERQSRGEQARALLARSSSWRTRLEQDFEVRRYAFDSQLRSLDQWEDLQFDGVGSSLGDALRALQGRLSGRNVAGVLLVSDGNVDLPAEEELRQPQGDRLPPVYPLLLDDDPPRDVAIARVAVSQTNFETAPVTVSVEIATAGDVGPALVAQLLDESGKELQRQTISTKGDEDDTSGRPLALRFPFRPEELGVSFYQVRVAPEGELGAFERPARSREATLVNNVRWFAVDRGGGPYRVLYVSGRPNWEIKFLRRALEEDEEVELAALVRIAKREPKFAFRARGEDSRNPLVSGFDGETAGSAEDYDQPVLVRLGTRDEAELRDGFPKAPEELFVYHALVLDDLEAGFFTQDQMLLIKQFVSHRGGGVLMLGGAESFAQGEYAGTPIGDLLPVYLDRMPPARPSARWRLSLTRDGWLEDWARVRSTEAEEQARLASMPPFATLNRAGALKPGAMLVAEAVGEDGDRLPALAITPIFGRGRAGALLVGDLWRWHLRRDDPTRSDAEQLWRQSMRWLVGNVPGRVEVEIQRDRRSPQAPISLETTVRDERFNALDNAQVTVKIATPSGDAVELAAAPSERKAGVYEASYLPREPGVYRATVTAVAPDGSEAGRRDVGWTADPAADEHRRLAVDRATLERLASATGGEVIGPDALSDFVASLPNRKETIVEPWTYPLWHRSSILLVAVLLLAGEWGARRLRGLP